MSLFGPSKLIQTYDEAVALIETGEARLVTSERYDDAKTSVPLANRLELDHAIYTAFARHAPGNVKSFVCGPFGDWDGTHPDGMYCDGMVFGVMRQPFMDALQHHRDEDGARWLWAFVTRWQSFMVLNPTVKVVQVFAVSDDGGEEEFDTYEDMAAARDQMPMPSTGVRTSGQVTRIKAVTA